MDALDFLIERLHIGCTVYDGEKERGETPTLASRRAAIRPWRESRRLLIMRRRYKIKANHKGGIEGEEANLFCKVAGTIRGVQDLVVEH